MQICVFRQIEEIHWPPENAPSWYGQWHSKELAISDLDFDLSNTIPESEKKLSGQQDFSQKNYPGKACKLQHQRICNKCALNLKLSKFQIPPQSTSVIEIWNDWFFSSPQIAAPPILFWVSGSRAVWEPMTDWQVNWLSMTGELTDRLVLKMLPHLKISWNLTIWPLRVRLVTEWSNAKQGWETEGSVAKNTSGVKPRFTYHSWHRCHLCDTG